MNQKKGDTQLSTLQIDQAGDGQLGMSFLSNILPWEIERTLPLPL
jgi:hypothetical protein